MNMRKTILGSARLQRAGFGVPPKRTSRQDPRKSAEIANLQEKFAKAKRLRQHAASVRSPDSAIAAAVDVRIMTTQLDTQGFTWPARVDGRRNQFRSRNNRRV